MDVRYKLLDTLLEFNPINLEHNEACEILFSHENKKIKLIWSYPVMEIYFDFFESEEKIYTEWHDYYENKNR